MLVPMLLLAAACIGVGLLGMVIVPALSGVVSGILGFDAGPELQTAAGSLRSYHHRLRCLAAAYCADCLAAPASAFGPEGRKHRHLGLRLQRPHARMQYSASSFAQPITALFKSVLQNIKACACCTGIFPRSRLALRRIPPDACFEKVYRPLFEGLRRLCGRCAVLQHGNVHLYVLYIVITLVGLLVWQMR